MLNIFGKLWTSLFQFYKTIFNFYPFFVFSCGLSQILFISFSWYYLSQYLCFSFLWVDIMTHLVFFSVLLVGIMISFGWYIQLTNSSQAKHGGAYFSAVFGRKLNMTTVLRPCQPLACCWRVGIASAPTLFTTSTKHHGSRWCGWSDLSLLFTSICDTEQILVFLIGKCCENEMT